MYINDEAVGIGQQESRVVGDVIDLEHDAHHAFLKLRDAHATQKTVGDLEGFADQGGSQLGIVQVEENPVRIGDATGLVLDFLLQIDGDAGVVRRGPVADSGDERQGAARRISVSCWFGRTGGCFTATKPGRSPRSTVRSPITPNASCSGSQTSCAATACATRPTRRSRTSPTCTSPPAASQALRQPPPNSARTAGCRSSRSPKRRSPAADTTSPATCSPQPTSRASSATTCTSAAPS